MRAGTQSCLCQCHSSIIHNNPKLETPLFLSTYKYIEKVPYVYVMEYYSALKSDEILTYATMWMKLEYTMLKEKSQSQEEEYWQFHLS